MNSDGEHGGKEMSEIVSLMNAKLKSLRYKHQCMLERIPIEIIETMQQPQGQPRDEGSTGQPSLCSPGFTCSHCHKVNYPGLTTEDAGSTQELSKMIASLKTHYDARMDVSEDMSDMQGMLAKRFARSHSASPPLPGHRGRAQEDPLPHYPSANPGLVMSSTHSGSDTIPHPVWLSPEAHWSGTVIAGKEEDEEDEGGGIAADPERAFDKLSAVLGSKYR